MKFCQLLSVNYQLLIIATGLVVCRPECLSDGTPAGTDDPLRIQIKEMYEMKTGENGLALIRQFEGLRLEAYRCPAGKWTIGYGHTCNVEPGDRISREEAEELLQEDLAPAEALVNRECPGLTQYQFDALVSLAMNIGEGNFRRSTLLKCVKANPSNPNIRNEIARWNKSGGMILAGLLRRRRAETDLYFKE